MRRGAVLTRQSSARPARAPLSASAGLASGVGVEKDMHSDTIERKAVAEDAIFEIERLDRPGCLAQWREAFGRPPPKHLSLPFMKRVLIWEAQNKAFGGVSAKTTRRLRQIASGSVAPTIAKPGSVLVREWNGRTYQVEVVAGGYVMDGKTWRSLSAIARHITGAHWSGPRFFGVQ